MNRSIFLLAAASWSVLLVGCATGAEVARAEFSERYHCAAKDIRINARPDVGCFGYSEEAIGCGRDVLFKCQDGVAQMATSTQCQETDWCTTPGCRPGQAATERFAVESACPVARATTTVLEYPPPPAGAENDPERLALWKSHTLSVHDTYVRVVGCGVETVYLCHSHGWEGCKLWKAPVR